MEKADKESRANPSKTANWLSTIFFCWLSPLLRIGNKRTLEEDDMYKVNPEDQSDVIGRELQGYWEEEVQKASRKMGTPSLWRAIIRFSWKSFMLQGIFTLMEETIKVIQPLFLGKIIRYFESYDPDDQGAFHEALGYAAGLSLCALVTAVLHHYYFYQLQRVGWRLRVATCHLIYKKALTLSNEAMLKTTTGQIVNLLSNDVNRFDEVTIFLHFLWAGPVQGVAVVCLLWYEIGPSCLAGLAILLVLMPVQAGVGKLFSKYRNLTAALTDTRIRTMNEVVSGIRTIKMYAWEKPFAALVSDIRRKEISMVMKSSNLRAVNMASFFCTSKLILFITFTIYVLLGNQMSASRVFVAVSLYASLRLTITLFFPAAIERLFECFVSIDRIQVFLMLDIVTQGGGALAPDERKHASLEIKDLLCYWDKSVDTPTLQGVSVALKSNDLLAVIGPVGAGKSSLLNAVLGELRAAKGSLRVSGKLTYASQQPWVFPGTIRSNILFGEELNPQMYERVLKACALKRDLELFPDGDLTLIGDRGATLSGGQRARINLARAAYQDADIYLLDDPLSAVDADVGRQLFEQCICGLLKNKARILVTHQLQYLNVAKEILVLKEGKMVAKGTYTELQQSGLDFTTLLKEEDEPASPGAAPELGHRTRTMSQCSALSRTSSVHSLMDVDQLTADVVPTVAEESRAEHSVEAGMYVKYLRAGASLFSLVIVMLINVIALLVYILQDWWLAYWADEQDKLNANITSVPPPPHGQNVTAELDTDFYLSVYAGLTGATILFGFSRNLLFYTVLVKSARNLHNLMFDAVLKAPVSFYDMNPIGRVLNRFSKDTGMLDSHMPWTFVDFFQLTLQIFGVIGVASSVIPWLLIPVVPLVLVFFYLRRYFLRTSRDIKRLEATTRSPVFSHLSSSLNGLVTIRAFRCEERFQRLFDNHQDLNSEACFLFLTISRWFAIRLDSICALFITFTAFGCMLLRDQLDAGPVGLALTYAVTLVGMFQWGIRQSTEVENMMTSVERVVEYAKLESEAPWVTEKRPPADWPKRGLVTFDQVSFRYTKDGPAVLRDLKVMFRPKEKVGIVGRTGAGKSSLISALFRLAEPEGEIYIDGVLTSEIGLHDLRQKMSIIPQDPVLFTGSMRKNLDPFNQHTDEELWDVLQEVQMKYAVEELPAKLETVLAESGANFSVGQRQLVCLARAILRKNRILIIDEATANVDHSTDELIQQTIRDKFRECTVLTIAHRLNTIIDNDRILVLDAGKIQAYDEPHTLLQDTKGIFYNMVKQTGKQEAEALMETAKKTYESRSRTATMTNGHAENFVICETAM